MRGITFHVSRFTATATATAILLAIAGNTASADNSYPPITPRPLVFPADHGAHPDFRTEWWYATGWLTRPDGKPLGFQVTFFRSRLNPGVDNPSAFAARQIIVAHAALSDPGLGRLQSGQKIAREGFGLAGAEEGDARAWVDDWSFRREGELWRAEIPAGDFRLDLSLRPTVPLLLQGDAGYSRKGPTPGAASHYYSLPQMAVSGVVERAGKREAVSGSAWLDHEWSSSYLEPEAAGWDWVGLNLADGGALMAFRMRGRDGGVRWSAATHRDRAGTVRRLEGAAVAFTPGRRWKSPRTGTEYPVQWRLVAGALDLELVPLMDDQEHDTRASTGAVYWEGAVSARAGGREAGRGYLELTGYGATLRMGR